MIFTFHFWFLTGADDKDFGIEDIEADSLDEAKEKLIEEFGPLFTNTIQQINIDKKTLN